MGGETVTWVAVYCASPLPCLSCPACMRIRPFVCGGRTREVFRDASMLGLFDNIMKLFDLVCFGTGVL
jgi:hypothetical protein